MANKKRLIDANATKAIIQKEMNKSDFQLFKDVMQCVCNILDYSDTVDAVEVTHGRWEKAEYHGFLRCSECKDVYIDDTWVADGKWNYCPNCCAKMDGDGNA